jgi:signal peptidase I
VTVVRTNPASAKGRTFWKELPILIAAALVVAFLVRLFVVQTFWVPSGSMLPTLHEHDRVIVNKLVFHFNSPDRGEVVVFHSPESWRNDPSETVFVKRLIGLPGDHVVCCDTNGRLLVNGQAVDEPYLNFTESARTPADNAFTITVPADRVWVMGDNRYASGDSYYNWNATHDIQQSTIPESALIGRAFVLFWPFSHWKWLGIPSGWNAVPS